MNRTDGILVIDKPSDFTSFDVIAKLRGMTKIRRIGHSGTLDPMATGVLPVFIGSATRATDILPIEDKEYIAGFKLGVSTDTQDITGKVTNTVDCSIKEDLLLSAAENFRGEIMQTPPMYSAVQKDGVRLYDLARQGIEVERESKKRIIYEIELLSFDEKEGEGNFRVLCSKGTYIRTLISDIGDELGCGAILTALRRTRSSGFTLEDSITLTRAQQLTDEGTILSHVRPVSDVFITYPKVFVSPKQAVRFKNGGSLNLNYLRGKFNEFNIFTVFSQDGEFLGLGKPDDGELKIVKLFLS